MATYSTGITATWNSVLFQEVVDLAWSYGGASAKDRGLESQPRWTDEAGSVSITCLGTANIDLQQYGKRYELSLSGGGQFLTNNAIYEGLAVTPELNGITRYTVTFRLLDN